MNANHPKPHRTAGFRICPLRAGDTAFAVPIEFRGDRIQNKPCRSLGHYLIRLREHHTLKTRAAQPLRFVTES